MVVVGIILLIFAFISFLFLLLAFFAGEPFKKGVPKNEKQGVWILIVFLTILITIFVIIGINSFSFNPVPSYDSNRKEKCAWCGKEVDKEDMIGTWCRDCSNDAFGHNGWYNK